MHLGATRFTGGFASSAATALPELKNEHTEFSH